MKIAFIVDVFPKLSETFILDQITGLMDLGHSVEIFSAARPQDETIHREIETYRLLEHTHYHNEVPRSRFHRILKGLSLFGSHISKSPSAVMRSLNVFKYGKDVLSLHLFFKTVLLLTKGNFDIIQCHFGNNGTLGAVLKEMGIQGKIVTMFHGYDIRRGIETGGSIYNKLFKYGDCFLAISNFSYEHLLKFGADRDKIVRHPVGISLERFPFRWHTPLYKLPVPVKILTVARLTEEKGLFHGIQAIERLVERHPDLRLEYAIVGGGPLKHELMKFIEDVNIENVVRFLGPKNREQVIKALGQAHLFLLPSNVEVLPVVLMEAQATGLPVVATSVGAVSELVKDGKSGFLVPERDVDAMAEKLEYLIRHPEIWVDIGRVGRRHIEEHYNIKKLNKRLVEIYEGLLR